MRTRESTAIEKTGSISPPPQLFCILLHHTRSVYQRFQLHLRLNPPPQLFWVNSSFRYNQFCPSLTAFNHLVSEPPDFASRLLFQPPATALATTFSRNFSSGRPKCASSS